MKGKYIILSNSDLPPKDDILRYDIEGIANTPNQARKLIQDETKDVVEHDHELTAGRHENYCSRYLIARIEEVVLPVPVVELKVKVELEDVG